MSQGVILHEGTLQLNYARHSWRRGFPTWRGMGAGCLKRARPVRRKDSECGMESNGEPLMVPLGCGHSGFKVGVCED